MNAHTRDLSEWDDRDLTLGPPLPPEAFRPGDGTGAEEPETAVLSAITSGYEDARARIISSPPVPPAGRHRADPPPEITGSRWAPTVPVDLGSGLPRPPRGTPAAAPPAVGPRRRRRDLLRTLLVRLGNDLGRTTPYPYS